MLDHVDRMDIWTSKGTLAGLLGITERHFSRAVRPLVPDDATRQEGRRILYHASRVLGAWRDAAVAAGVEKALKSAASGARGTDSSGLERYRKARAALAELELERQRDSVVRRDVMRPGLGRMADFVREAGVQLRRQYGNPAGDLLDEALDEFESQIDTIFRPPAGEETGS